MLITIVNVCNFTMLMSAYRATTKGGKDALLEVNKDNALTHYMVCTSNRLKIDVSSILNDQESLSFVLKEQVSDDSWESHQVSMPAVLGGVRASISVKGVAVILSGEGKEDKVFDNAFIFMLWLAQFLDDLHRLAEVLRLKCVYIGQTELKQNYIRLQGHEKVQHALAEIVQFEPQKEAFIKLLSFQPPSCNALMIPDIPSSPRSDWLPDGDLLKYLPMSQRSNLIEGALINYFKPSLNVKLKHNFPSSRHESYGYFYDRNVRSVVVELHEEFRAYVTSSDHAPARKIFLIEYKLSSDDDGVFIHDNSRQDLDERILGRSC